MESNVSNRAAIGLIDWLMNYFQVMERAERQVGISFSRENPLHFQMSNQITIMTRWRIATINSP